jgi:hypothetical protein
MQTIRKENTLFVRDLTICVWLLVWFLIVADYTYQVIFKVQVLPFFYELNAFFLYLFHDELTRYFHQ